jgi:hypothetical protein
MKRILSFAKPAEAHLVAETLRQEGIVATVHEEWGAIEGPSVWIENDADAERATTLVAEMMAGSRPAPAAVQPRNRSPVFVGGLFLGLLLGVAMPGLFGGRVSNTQQVASSQTWDTNGDGTVDSWARYDAAGRLTASSDDRNYDGTPDYWQTFDPPGVLSADRADEDFDGREDLWNVYEKGIAVSYTADNDRNGVVDEWGRLERGVVVERNWSFKNDRVADKRAHYRAGRKLREEYDRNRDGVFDQAILLDEFERVISRR